MTEIDSIQAAVWILLLLQVKHFLADFVWQTDRMIQEKGSYLAAHGIYHSGIHGLGTFLILTLLHPALGIIIGIVDFLAHYHIDWAKVKINQHKKYTPADKQFWFWLGFDQLLHQITYILIVGWVFFAF